MSSAPKSLRLHIGIFGRRNVGKSSLLNALTHQAASLVSEVAGTTTDPVEKPMELLPLGPVLFIDTAGVDDVGALGELRVGRTLRALDRTEVAVLVLSDPGWGEYEERLLCELRARKTPTIVVWTKADVAAPSPEERARLQALKVPFVQCSSVTGQGMDELRQTLIKSAPESFVDAPPLVGDLVQPGDVVVLVTPIDKEAPKGRLILPQVQTIRDLLDHGAVSVVATEHQLPDALSRLAAPPSLVVTDSQAFQTVAAATPPGVRMTSFSILFARSKGDLSEFVRGATAIDRLRPGDKVMVYEACTHHPIEDDIGTVKIPRLLNRHVGGPLEFVHVRGSDFPDDLNGIKLVIHCGACMNNRRSVLSRMERCRRAGVPVTNYGLSIAYALGIFERALEPFPDALAAYRAARSGGQPPYLG